MGTIGPKVSLLVIFIMFLCNESVALLRLLSGLAERNHDTVSFYDLMPSYLYIYIYIFSSFVSVKRILKGKYLQSVLLWNEEVS